jgi:hypothetical protein
VVSGDAGGELADSILATVDPGAFVGIRMPCPSDSDADADESVPFGEDRQMFNFNNVSVVSSLGGNTKSVLGNEDDVACENLPQLEHNAAAAYELFGCANLNVEIEDGGAGGVRVTGASSFDPRPTPHGSSLLHASEFIGAFQRTLWLDRLSWLDSGTYVASIQCVSMYVCMYVCIYVCMNMSIAFYRQVKLLCHLWRTVKDSDSFLHLTSECFYVFNTSKRCLL